MGKAGRKVPDVLRGLDEMESCRLQRRHYLAQARNLWGRPLEEHVGGALALLEQIRDEGRAQENRDERTARSAELYGKMMLQVAREVKGVLVRELRARARVVLGKRSALKAFERSVLPLVERFEVEV